MQKWRQYYLLKQRKAQRILNDEVGITLVELLAAISILSIVILLAGSVHMFGQRQFIDQTKSASQENDISHAMTVMTTDLRKLRPGETIEVEGSTIVTDRYSYEFNLDKKQLEKGDTVLAEGVTGSFQSKENDEGDRVGVNVEIKSLAGDGPQKEYETTIYFRR